MADGDVHLHPAVERMALRRRMSEAVERLLDTVDVLLRELATDEPDADLEPSLGAPEHPAHLNFGGGWRIPAGIFEWSRGSADDREADNTQGPRGSVASDDEPSLGANFTWNQRRWGQASTTSDLEQDHDGREPSLGSVAVQPWEDQRRWAAAGDQGEREDASEDEGAQVDTGSVDPDEDPGEAVVRIEVGLS